MQFRDVPLSGGGVQVLGQVLRRSAGLESDDTSQERFRLWLADQVNVLLVPGSKRDG